MKEEHAILVIDDEVQIRRLLEITLAANDYLIAEASTGKEGLLLAASSHPDLIILDLGLPDIEGITVLKSLREWYEGPVIILSVRNSEEDIIQALDSGANDYLTKPFRTGELLARIRVAMRQAKDAIKDSCVQYGNLTIDFARRYVSKNGEDIKLTTTEYALLALMAKNEGRVLTHQYLLNQVWGKTYTEQSQYLRVYIAQLRKKFEDDPSQPKLLKTESGIGYRFCG